MRPTELSFKTLCQFFEATAKASGKLKVVKFRSLLEKNLERDSDELYEVFRLILPYRDKLRGNYDLKEAKLVHALCKACILDPKVHENARKATEWRQPGTPNSGNFPAVMQERLFNSHCMKAEGMPAERDLKVGQLNEKLDELVRAKGDDKAAVLRDLIHNTSPSMMKWITHIILKDLKIGLRESTIFKEYHPDAEALFNITMDLKKVVLDLRDRSFRIPKKEIEPGCPVRPQLAKAVSGVKEAFAKMRGLPFVIDTKFDGERMQLHCAADKIYYWSRSGTEHGEQYGYTVFDCVVKAQLAEDTCVLDGEMLAWNKTRGAFEEFGGLKSAFLAANSNAQTTARLPALDLDDESPAAEDEIDLPTVAEVEIVYIAFDVLYTGGQSVMDKPLSERQRILGRLVGEAAAEGVPLGKSAMRGRICALLPNRPTVYGACRCLEGHTERDIDAAFEAAVDKKEEGIIVKSLASPWKANDRVTFNWVKLKPDYVRNREIDAVIIGGHYGTGHRGGVIAEYLLALAEAHPPGEQRPKVFVSFCRVGTGLTARQREEVHKRLEPLFIEADPRRNNAPASYRVVHHHKSRPDVWISDPYKSIVLQVKADERLIQGTAFAAQYSLRFPRVERIRDDKTAADVQSLADLLEQFDQEGGKKGLGQLQGQRKRAGSAKKPGKPQQLHNQAAESFRPVDTSRVAKVSDLLAGKKIHVLVYGEGRKDKAAVAELVESLGGEVYASSALTVTHHLTADPGHWRVGICAQSGRDVVSLDWLLEVADSGLCFHPRPRDYVHLSQETRAANSEMDAFGDLFSVNSEAPDIAALLERHISLADVDIGSLKPAGWSGPFSATDLAVQVDEDIVAAGLSLPLTSLFRGCNICLVPEMSQHPTSAEPELEQLRLAYLESLVRLCGGRLSSSLEPSTTHLVWLSEASRPAATALMQQIAAGPDSSRALPALREGLRTGSLHIVKPSWLEESLDRAASSAPDAQRRRLPERGHLHGVLTSAERPEEWPWGDYNPAVGAAEKPAAEKEESLKESAAGSTQRRPKASSSGGRKRPSEAIGAAKVVSKRHRGGGFGAYRGLKDFKLGEARPAQADAAERSSQGSRPRQPSPMKAKVPRVESSLPGPSTQTKLEAGRLESPLKRRRRLVKAQPSPPPDLSPPSLPATSSGSPSRSTGRQSRPDAIARKPAFQPGAGLPGAFLQRGQEASPPATKPPTAVTAPTAAVVPLSRIKEDPSPAAAGLPADAPQRPQPTAQPSGLLAALLEDFEDDDEDMPGPVAAPQAQLSPERAPVVAPESEQPAALPASPPHSGLSIEHMEVGDRAFGASFQAARPMVPPEEGPLARPAVAAPLVAAERGAEMQPPADMQSPGGSQRQAGQAAGVVGGPPGISPSPKRMSLKEKMAARRALQK